MEESAERKRVRLAALEAEAARLRDELKALDAESEPASGREATPRAGLSKREALLMEAERVAHLGSWSWSLRTDEITFSDEFYRILGMEPEAVLPSRDIYWSAVHPDDRARVIALSERAEIEGRVPPHEYRIVRPSGEVRHVRVEGARLTDEHGDAFLVGTMLDVTERTRVAQLVERTVAELNEAQRIAGLASWRWDLVADQLEWSLGMFRLMEIPETSTPSRALFLQHVHSDDLERIYQLEQRALDDTSLRAFDPFEFRMVCASGKVIRVVEYSVTHRDAADQLIGFRGVIQDITERKALEDQLRHSQKMEAVGTLAGGVAHDFNNYLMVIAGYTELLGGELPEGHPARESVAAIAEAYQRCAHLTQQLLTLSRKRPAHPVTLDLPSHVSRLVPLMSSVLGELVQLRLMLPTGNLSIVADPLQVEQALMNLVVNARDAMPEGGELAVRVEPGVDAVKKRPLVRLSVVDAGCGIPYELHSRIFEPFFTTKPVGRGTGLGLSTVYAIVRDAGGHISFESTPGVGTTFHLEWPRVEPAADSGKVSQPEPLWSRGEGRSILLVEDVSGVRELLAMQLERAGFRVSSAPHGLAALELLREQHFDLVVSDLVMPQLGGLQLARELRQRFPGVRCLLMTGHSPEEQANEEHSGEELLRKPFSTGELLRAVWRALGEP